MKTILCFGDSNTWGYNAQTGLRHKRDVRWTGVLQKKMENKAVIIEEGLNGRTTMFNEPIRDNRNGSLLLAPLIESHSPLDLIIIALGANDLKPIYNADGYYSALGIQKLIKIAKAESDLGILIITPTLFSNTKNTRFLGGKDKFSLLISEYEKIADEEKVHFLDSNDFIETSDDDGVHLDEKNHFKLGVAVSEKVLSIF